MQTSLSHLPAHKQVQLKEITDTIIKAVGPQKVSLFGSHTTGRLMERRYCLNAFSSDGYSPLIKIAAL